MPLAYYSVAAEQEFWTEHWGGHSVAEMLAVARRSPLTALLLDALGAAPGRRVLEAGCGLGQYVILLRERGWRAIGVDWSQEALAACRAVAGTPLARMDLRALAVRDRSIDACLSLGVMEHDVAGPDALLAETARVLAGGGLLLVSVPYVNGVRRVTASWVASRSREVARRGGGFYQYAFTRTELRAALERHGFAVRGMHPYDPARLLRRILPREARARIGGAPAPESTGVSRRHGVRAVAKRLLYTRPALALLGHMVLAVAVKR
jgi:SAM-dependent methyltransferase